MEKEAKRKLSFEEFRRLVQVLEDVPQRGDETQREYLARLRDRYGARSRFTMQMIIQAITDAEDEQDLEEIWQLYRDKVGGKKPEPPAEEQKAAEEQVPGQMRMEIPERTMLKAAAEIQSEPETDRIAAGNPEPYYDQVKMMRFIAGQVDKLYMKMDKVNDTLCQILRVMRKE